MHNKNTGQLPERLSFVHVLVYFYTWRKLLLGFCAAGLITGALLAFFLPRKYNSTAVVFPSRTNLADKVLYDEDFGYEVHAEWLMEILNSSAIFDSLLVTGKLAEHYEVDTTSKYWRKTTQDEYEQHVTVLKSFRKSLSISVNDKDPEFAKWMCDEILRLANVVRESMLKANKGQAIAILEEELGQRKAELQNFEKENDETLSDPSLQITKDKFDRFRSTTLQQEKLLLQYETLLARYSDAKYRYEDAVRRFENSIPAIYIISPPQVNYKKVFPKFSVFLPLFSGMGLVIGVLFIFAADQIKRARIILRNGKSG